MNVEMFYTESVHWSFSSCESGLVIVCAVPWRPAQFRLYSLFEGWEDRAVCGVLISALELVWVVVIVGTRLAFVQNLDS